MIEHALLSSPRSGEGDREAVEGSAKPINGAGHTALRAAPSTSLRSATSPWNGEERGLSLQAPEPPKYRAMKRARSLRKRMTDAELILWSRLRAGQLEGFKFRRQHPVAPYIADFACVELKLIVELDGDTHGTPQELAHDARRTGFLEAAGWTVIRAFNIDVYQNLDGVLTQISDALHTAGRAAALSSPRSGEGDRVAVEGSAKPNASSQSLTATPSTLRRDAPEGHFPASGEEKRTHTQSIKGTTPPRERN
jgi:very-short-patch-repair endonuclease